ncbi:hypothetical protein [Liquorilactobacillus capillatus]|nr:hypothetical protein [Liquorilactobacillus capillatus]
MDEDRKKLNEDRKRIEEDMKRGLLSYKPSTFLDGWTVGGL